MIKRQIANFKLDHTIELISKSPEIFPVSFEKKNTRKAVVEDSGRVTYWSPRLHGQDLGGIAAISLFLI